MLLIRALGLLWLADIAAAAWLSRHAGRHVLAWTLVAAVTGPLALLALLRQNDRHALDFVVVTSIVLAAALVPVGAALAVAHAGALTAAAPGAAAGVAAALML